MIFLLAYLNLKLFGKKLMVLMVLECVMLCAIFFYSLQTGYYSNSFFIPLILSIFMVLDSVFCVSFLISETRSALPASYFYSSF